MSEPDPLTEASIAETRLTEASIAETRLTEARFRREAASLIAGRASQGPCAVDPELADYMGAFEESALGLEEALDSAFDALHTGDNDNEGGDHE